MVLYFYFRVRYVIFLKGCFSHTLNMDVVQVILLTLVIQAAAGYYISEKKSKWEEAAEKCNMAVPDLHPSEDGFNVRIDFDLNNRDVWLGYFMKMTVFDYIGCVTLDHSNQNQILHYNSVGLCYTLCKGKEVIGVSLDKCICIDTWGHYSKHETNCNTSCGLVIDGVACGGNGYMSVYKVNKNVSAGDRETQCLSFERYNDGIKLFKWKNCATNYARVVCENELNFTDNYPWLKSVNQCFKNGVLPKSYQALTNINSRTDPFWSGVISSDVIYNYTEWNNNLQYVKFGYLSTNKRVNFRNTDGQKYLLCHGTPSELETTSLPFGTESTNQPKTTTDKIESTTTKKGQDVSVIIGVSVGACVVIIAAVAFFLLKRRGKVPNLRKRFIRTCCTEPDATTKDDADKLSTVIKDSRPNTVNSEKECNNYTNNVHNYCVLEPSNRNHNTHDINHERNQPVENGNIYNEIETEGNTYAYVDKKEHISLDEDYDTTEKKAKKLKRKADNINGDYAELENDAYSHIGKSAASACTDQTYNIPNRDDSYSKMDEANDENDTYSHLNSKQSGGSSNNADNVYHTTNGFKDTNI